MSLRDRIIVEPLPSERWKHLEQRVVAHVGDAVASARPRGPRYWLALPALAVAGAVALTVVALGGGATRPAPPLVVAADDGGAHVELGDAVIDATPGTRFTVTRPDGGVRIALAAGTVSLEVAPRRDRPPLWVIAGDVSVRVVGTAFTVRRLPAVSVEVSHGVVEVERAGAAVAVGAGEQWSIDGAGHPQVAAVIRTDRAVADRTVADRAGGDVALNGTVAAVDPLRPGGAAIAFDPLRDRHGVAPPIAPTDAQPRAGARPDRKTARDDRAAPPPPADPLLDLHQAIAALGVPAGPSIGASSPADAIAAFQRASVDGRGPAASAALWGLGRAQWAAGRTGDALRSLDAYQRRFPSGGERDAVGWLRLRLLCSRDIDDRCRAAAHGYADHATDGPRRSLAVRITQTR